MKVEVDASGLTADEVREAIKNAQRSKNRSLEEIKQSVDRVTREIATLRPEFAMELIDLAMQNNPQTVDGVAKIVAKHKAERKKGA